MNSNPIPNPDQPVNLSGGLHAAMQLITALCDERITREQFNQLQSLVCTDREVRRFYVDMMHLHAGLYYFASALPSMLDEPAPAGGQSIESETIDKDPSGDLQPLGMNETMVLPAITEPVDFQAGEDLVMPGPSSDTTPPQPARLSPSVIRGGIAAGLLLVFGLIAYVASVGNHPSTNSPTNNPSLQVSVPVLQSPQWIATSDLDSNPVWKISPAHPEGFAAGDSLRLQSGLVQLKLGPKGKLVVEGPAEIDFVSETEISLTEGKIVATFPGGGLIVRCPTGSITDLGTEFGVSVDPLNGNSEVEVFQGSVSAALSHQGTTEPSGEPSGKSSGQSSRDPAAPTVLKIGQAAVLSRNAVTPSPQGAIRQRYICSLTNPGVRTLDVTDLICGGDGTSNRRGIAVDATTGDIGVLTPVGIRPGDHLYHKVHGFPVVDGAFVPDGSSGLVTVDSAGDRFAFPPTVNSVTNQIWTGGQIPWPDEIGISTVVGGVDYSTPRHSVICTHSDNAITLDLNAIRRLYPDRRLAGFHCHCVNSYVNGLKGAMKRNPVASVYVLLDGKSRYEKLRFSNQDSLFAVDVSITKNDRFLTLAALDDGKEIDRDWILWLDASLTVVPAVPASPVSASPAE
jgi:hypothetical protein